MLIVETGTGDGASESYCSVAFATAFHANRGAALWATLTVPQSEQALRRATDYMVAVYRKRWKGWRVFGTQALDWPRNGVYLDDFGYPQNNYSYGTYEYLVPNNIVPLQVQQCCATLALVTADGTSLLPDLQQGIVREKVGPLETEYDKFSPRHPVYSQVQGILAVYLQSSNLGAKVGRT